MTVLFNYHESVYYCWKTIILKSVSRVAHWIVNTGSLKDYLELFSCILNFFTECEYKKKFLLLLSL